MSDKIHGYTDVTGAEFREHQEDILAKRVTDVGSDLQLRVSYDGSGNAEYVGMGAKGLAADTTGWLIAKYTYDGSNRVTLKQTVVGIWDSRTGLSFS